MNKKVAKELPQVLTPTVAHRTVDIHTGAIRDIKRSKAGIYSAREIVAGKPGTWKRVGVMSIQEYIEGTKHLTLSECQARTTLNDFTKDLHDSIIIKTDMVLEVAFELADFESYDETSETVLLKFKDESQLFFGENFKPRFEVVA